MLTIDTIFTIIIIAAITLALALELAKAGIVVFPALLLLLLKGILTPKEAFQGFSNHGLLSVGFLYIVAAALQATGVIGSIK